MYRRARPVYRHALFGLLLAALAAPTLVGPAVVSGSDAISSTSTSTPTSPTARTVEGYLITWTNRDRAARGLRPLRLWSALRIGLAYRWSAHATYASIVFTESRDHTPARAAMVDSGRIGTTAWFRWRGYDPLLQTHTAGLRNFDVEYKVGSGTWRIIRSGTTSTSISLYSRPRGHYYYLRVRARDRNGNVGAWSTPMRVGIP